MKFRVAFFLLVLVAGLLVSVRFFMTMKAWRDRPSPVAAPGLAPSADSPPEAALAGPPAPVIAAPPPSATPEDAPADAAPASADAPTTSSGVSPGSADFDSTPSTEIGVIFAGASGAETSPDSPGRRRSVIYTEDWPRFLGPDTTGVSRELNLQLDWPDSGPVELWRLPLGAAYSAPVALGERLVVFHRLADEEVLDCLNTESGELLWRFAYPTDYVDQLGFNGGPRSSPAIDGDRVYSFGAEGVLSCVDLASGSLFWQRDLHEEYGVPQNFFGVGVSPVIEGNLILLNLGGPQGAGLIALNKTLGATVWTSTREGASYSTPIVRTIRDERLAIFLTREGLLVVEPGTGATRYRYDFRSVQEASVNAASPVIVGDVVFLSASYNVGAVALRLGLTGVAEVWRDPRAMSNHWATSIYSDGYLYGMDGRHENGSNFRCIDFQTGNVRWTADEGLGRAAFIMAEHHLIALGERGELALIEARPDRYVEKERFEAMTYPCWTPPILARGLLFLRGETELACFDLRKTSYF